MNRVVTPIKILKSLLSLITLLLFANILGLISRFYFGHDELYGLVDFFDFNTEKNIPTFYSSITLIIASILLLLIGSTHRRLNNPYVLWVILSGIFLFLSIDEIASIHEQFNVPTRDLFGTSGILYFAWVIPYIIGLCVFLILYVKFLFSLPKKIMVLFLTSGAIFIFGAVGLEMLGGMQAEFHGNRGLLYSILYTWEELFEMIGVALFIYALLEYIKTEFEFFKISIVKNIT